MQRIIFRAIVAGQAAVSDMAHGANPPDALCADGGSRERSVRVGGNQTARRAIILWRSRKAPLPPKSQRERKAPVKTSPGPSYAPSPTPWLAVSACVRRRSLGRRNKSYRLTRFITWQVATIAWVGLVPLWV